MTPEVQKYISFLEKQRKKLEEEIASKKRSLDLVLQKLAHPEDHLTRELKRGAVKVSKAVGHETVKTKTELRKKSPEIEVVFSEPKTDFSGPARVVAEVLESEPIEGEAVKKSSGTFF